MRVCCINECSSRMVDIDRTLFEISEARKEWINIIDNYRKVTCEGVRLFICDLHFHRDYINVGKKSTTLRKGAIPMFQPRNPSEGIDEVATNDSIEVSISQKKENEDIEYLIENTDDGFIFDPVISIESVTSNSLFAEPETQLKTITVQQYRNLMQLMVEVEKQKKIIQKLECLVIKKDSELKVSKEKESNMFNNLKKDQIEVIKCLIYGVRGRKYSPSIRLFCLRQQFHSNAAYEALRIYFNNNLPSKRTLQSWFSSVDGGPGINSDALKTIREKAEIYQVEKKHLLHLTLVSDEMAIRKQISWCHEKENFVGCSTLSSNKIPNQLDHENRPEPLKSAKDALVFLIVGPDFKIPVAYHLLNGLSSIDRAALTQEVIRSVEECGVTLMTLTSDGLHANIATAELLGANFEKKKTFFQSPTYPEQKIYVIFDPPHMLKLVRKHFSTGKLYSPNGLLDWNLLKILVEKQRMENFNLCNHLTQHHIDWCHKPMNVKLAAQTISKSVADTLEQLNKDGYEEFENATSTVEFLRNFNNIFDVLNFAEGRTSDNEYKKPICNESAEEIFSFLDEMKAFIESLKIEVKTKNGFIRKPILSSRAQMGFLGFYIDIVSLNGIYNDFVRNGPLKVFYPMQFSQDHLETLFSLIRNRQGCNDNPNSIEFASAFRKILVCHPLTTSKDHNVMTNATGILTVPYKSKKRTQPKNLVEGEKIEVNYNELISQEIEIMDIYDHHVCAHVALSIEERVARETKNAPRSRCKECAAVLLEPTEKINDELLGKKNKYQKQPCHSTVQIVIFSNAVIKLLQSGMIFNHVREIICSNLNMDELYNASSFEHNEQDHKETFLMQIVRTYLTLKSERIGNRIGDEERGKFIRNRLKHFIHQAGQ